MAATAILNFRGMANIYRQDQISNMASICHFGFAILQFWTTYEVPLSGRIFNPSGIMIRSDIAKTLRFCLC